MISLLIKILALPVLLGFSSGTWAIPTLLDLGGIGLGTRVVSGEITSSDFVGEDWYMQLGFEDEGFFYFDVFDFTVSSNMQLTITVEVDSTVSDLVPLLYLFRPGNAPDLLTQPSIWTKFDNSFTEIDFYLEQDVANPTAPLLAFDDGGAPAQIERDVVTANPSYRFIVTGEYYEVTDGNFWGVPDGIGETGSYTITFNGEAAYVPEPATLTLFGLGLAGLGYSRRKKA